MKLKVILADEDERYVKKFTYCIQKYYFDKVELAVFTSEDKLSQYLEKEKCDVMLYTDLFKSHAKEQISFLLVDKKDDETSDGVETLCKYQKVANIYKKILRSYADSKHLYKPLVEKDSSTRIITFLSAAGGSGKSLCAAAYARLQAMAGKRVLYLSLERIHSVDAMFQQNGDITLSQVMFWVKSGKGNIPLKLESALQKDYTGIYYFRSSKNPFELLEITSDDWKSLIEQIIALHKIDEIVIDTERAISLELEGILKLADRIVFVSCMGTNDENRTKQLIEGYRILEKQYEEALLDKTCIVLNKCRAGADNVKEIDGIAVIGNIDQMPIGLSDTKMIQMMLENHQADCMYLI